MLSESIVRVDSKALGVKMTKIDMDVKNGIVLIDKFRRCPIITESYLHGEQGMCMIVVTESKQFVNSFVSEHLEKNENIENVRTEAIHKSLHGFKTVMDINKKLETPPCGDHPCSQCDSYVDNGGECVGCPMTKFYKGKMWM